MKSIHFKEGRFNLIWNFDCVCLTGYEPQTFNWRLFHIDCDGLGLSSYIRCRYMDYDGIGHLKITGVDLE